MTLGVDGRGIRAVTLQNSEPSWIAYVGTEILLGSKRPSESGARWEAAGSSGSGWFCDKPTLRGFNQLFDHSQGCS
jgi:hypothetical protein